MTSTRHELWGRSVQRVNRLVGQERQADPGRARLADLDPDQTLGRCLGGHTRSRLGIGMWDYIGVLASGVVLCRVKTRDWPGTVEMETLTTFPVPANTRKLVHRWRDRQRLPDVRVL